MAAKPTIRLVARDWDYLTPIALGDVCSDLFDLQLHRADSLPAHLADEPQYDAGEISFSRYAQSRAEADDSVIALPVFLMRGFRQRCIITAKNSPLTTVQELAGKRVGLTGWQDSGTVWTRQIFTLAGVEMDAVHWFVGRLLRSHPIVDRLGKFGQSGRISSIDGEHTMLEMLEAGELDAVCTPFMPPGFYRQDSPFRQLLPNCREAEVRYFEQSGYVPGMHLLGFQAEFLHQHAELAHALASLISESTETWQRKRTKYADTTPWLGDELQRTAQELGDNWNINGIAPNNRMIQDFCGELNAQKIIERPLEIADLFPPSTL